MNTTSENFTVGLEYTNTTFPNYFNGTIDSVIVYNRALTPDEIGTVVLTLGELT